MDPNYLLPESFSLECVITIRSDFQSHTGALLYPCFTCGSARVLGVGMVGLSRFGGKSAIAKEGLARRQKDSACNLSVKQLMT